MTLIILAKSITGSRYASSIRLARLGGMKDIVESFDEDEDEASSRLHKLLVGREDVETFYEDEDESCTELSERISKISFSLLSIFFL